jgi:hypothetical protein
VYTIVKKLMIATGTWFAGWETQYTEKQLKKYLAERGIEPWSVYSRYFSPSLGYRVLREVLLKAGLKLPMRPVILSPVHRLRSRIRKAVQQSWLGPKTAVIIGVFARKPEKP